MKERNRVLRVLSVVVVVSTLLFSFSGFSLSGFKMNDSNLPHRVQDSWGALSNIPELEDHSAYWNPVPEPRAPGLVYILVEPGLYPSISSEIDRYMTDLSKEGWTPELYNSGWANPSQVKSLLQTGYSSGMVGAVFVGDIPIAWYEMEDWFGGVYYGWTEFPIELYYMDLDGAWIDENTNGKFEDHRVGLGDLEPEIWVGRILTSTLTLPGYTEVTMIQNYFDKNHDYRMGNLPLNDRALIYVDDDWAAWGTQYSDEVGLRYATRTLVNDNEVTRTADYLARLDDNYDWISLFAHSWPGGHGFYYNGGSQFEYLYNDEISEADPMAHFYNHFCCSAGNYSNSESEGYITGHYVFAPTYGLGAVASTKTGSMLNFADFYTPLGAGESIGQSFMDWFILNGETGAGADSRCWFYGMTVIGDPTLDTFDDGPPVVPPSVTVTQPNTPVTWNVSSSQEITWTATAGSNPLAIDPITIYYSYDDIEGDGPWNQIASNEANDGTYSWDPVPNTPSNNCWVIIEAQDENGTIGSDISDTSFTIEYTPPTVLVTSPNGGEVLMGGGNYPIAWIANAGGTPLLADSITIEYSSTGPGGPWNPLASGEINDGVYDWNPVPGLDETNCYVRVTVEDTAGYTGEDISNSSFEIDSTAPSPATNPYAELTGTNNVTIYWTASPSPEVDHYEVWYVQNGWDPTGDSYGLLAALPAGATEYLHAERGANNQNSYTYQVRTYDAAGNEARTTIQAAKFSRTLSYAGNPSHWWLLGSCIVQTDTSLNHVIQGQDFPANWDYALAWDATNQQWISNLKGRPDSLNGLTDITNEMGFWLHITDNARFATAGYISDMVIDLDAGWNLLPYPFAERNKNTDDIELDLQANCPNYVPGSLTIFDRTQPYYIRSAASDTITNNEEGFWIQVTADTVWTVINY